MKKIAIILTFLCSLTFSQTPMKISSLTTWSGSIPNYFWVPAAYAGGNYKLDLSTINSTWATDSVRYASKSYAAGDPQLSLIFPQGNAITCDNPFPLVKARTNIPVSYLWSDGGLYATPNSDSVFLFNDGTYWCRVTSLINGLSTTDTFQIVLNNSSSLAIITSSDLIAAHSSIALTAQSQPGSSYAWSLTPSSGWSLAGSTLTSGAANTSARVILSVSTTNGCANPNVNMRIYAKDTTGCGGGVSFPLVGNSQTTGALKISTSTIHNGNGLVQIDNYTSDVSPLALSNQNGGTTPVIDAYANAGNPLLIGHSYYRNNVVLQPNCTDNSTAKAFIFNGDGDSFGGFTTAGAKLISVQNHDVEKFSIDKDGNVNIPSGSTYQNNGTNHIYGGTSISMSCWVNTSAAPGATISVTGNDMAGKITFTTGNITLYADTIFGIHFIKNYKTNPYVIFSSGNTFSALNILGIYPYSWVNEIQFINDNNKVISAGTYIWYYHVIQ